MEASTTPIISYLKMSYLYPYLVFIYNFTFNFPSAFYIAVSLHVQTNYLRNKPNPSLINLRSSRFIQGQNLMLWPLFLELFEAKLYLNFKGLMMKIAYFVCDNYIRL